MLFKGDEKKVFKLNLDTHLYTRQIKDYQKYTNVIDLNLTKALLDLVNTVQDFLNEAQVKETSKASLSLGIKTNFDSKIALLRKSYICSLCNVEISGRENMIKHFCDQKHLKNVKIKDNLMQQNNDPPTVPIKNTSISSNHSDRAPSISSNKSNKAPSISSNHSNKAPSNPSERKSSDLKPLTTAQIQRNLKRAEKQEKLRMLALNPFSEELPKQTVQLLSKPIQQLEQLTMRLIDDGKALAKNIVTYQAVCSHIENALRVIYPNIKCYVFGSRITGLSTAKGDIDIFVDIGELNLFCFLLYILLFTILGGRFYNRPTKGEIFDAIHKTESFLKKTKKFSNFQKVLAARTPILKTFCLAERIDCDLSFSNGLSFCNTGKS